MTQLALFEQPAQSMQELLNSLPERLWHDCTWEACGPVEIDGDSEQQAINYLTCGCAGVRSTSRAAARKEG